MKKFLFVAMCLVALASCTPKQASTEAPANDSILVDSIAPVSDSVAMIPDSVVAAQ